MESSIRAAELMKPLVLTIEDCETMAASIEMVLSPFYRIRWARTAEEAIEILKTEETPLAVALVDVALPGMSGLDFLPHLQRISPTTVPIMITGVMKTIPMAVKAMKSGAYDYLEKPFSDKTLLEAVKGALSWRRVSKDEERQIPRLAPDILAGIWGRNASFLDCLRTLEESAPIASSILIEGETGTGKDLFAQLAHAFGPFAEGPFIALNCGNISPPLCSSELFGHEIGAFTDARTLRIGAFEQSMNGTLFLDEIGDMPIEVQPSLLRVLQEKVFTRVGGAVKIAWKGILVCATNQNLDVMIARGSFRLDLFHRIRKVRIRIPPLRDRLDDIPLLALRFFRKYGRPEVAFGKGVLEALVAYSWPGNVRELENLVQQLAQKQPQTEIPFSALWKEIQEAGVRRGEKPGGTAFRDLVYAKKRILVMQAMSESKGNRKQAARMLGTTASAFRKILRRLNLP